VKASCIATSAMSNDPEIRISVAMIRPDSCRNTLSAVVLASLMKETRQAYASAGSGSV